jgi:hypothetical protein
MLFDFDNGLAISETRCVRILNSLAKLVEFGCQFIDGNADIDSLSCERRGQAIRPIRSKTPACGLITPRHQFD